LMNNSSRFSEFIQAFLFYIINELGLIFKIIWLLWFSVHRQGRNSLVCRCFQNKVEAKYLNEPCHWHSCMTVGIIKI
jgi:hypothetical protein